MNILARARKIKLSLYAQLKGLEPAPVDRTQPRQGGQTTGDSLRHKPCEECLDLTAKVDDLGSKPEQEK